MTVSQLMPVQQSCRMCFNRMHNHQVWLVLVALKCLIIPLMASFWDFTLSYFQVQSCLGQILCTVTQEVKLVKCSESVNTIPAKLQDMFH